MAGLKDARDRIVQRLAALEAEASVLRHQLDLLDKAIDLEADLPVREKGRQRRPTNPPRSEVVDVVTKAAIAAGRPITRQEAMAAVTEAGLTITGARPVEVLATMLWRERAKVSKTDAGFWPADRPLPKKR